MPNEKRRFLRFGLRTLLLAMLAVCAVLGWKAERAKRQRAAVEWVRASGGTVRYEYQRIDPTGYPLASQPPGPTWLRDAIGIDFLDHVVAVHLSGARLSDVAPLSGLPELQSLDLCGTAVNDLAPLAGLHKLRTLDLTQCAQVSDLAPLARMTELRTIYLNSMPRVTDLSPLARLKKLEQLYAYNTPVSDIRPLAGLVELCNVDLLDSRAADLSALRNLKKLQTLRFRGGQVSTIEPLVGLKNVQITIWPGGSVRIPQELQGQVLRQ